MPGGKWLLHLSFTVGVSGGSFAHPEVRGGRRNSPTVCILGIPLQREPAPGLISSSLKVHALGMVLRDSRSTRRLRCPGQPSRRGSFFPTPVIRHFLLAAALYGWKVKLFPIPACRRHEKKRRERKPKYRRQSHSSGDAGTLNLSIISTNRMYMSAALIHITVASARTWMSLPGRSRRWHPCHLLSEGHERRDCQTV